MQYYPTGQGGNGAFPLVGYPSPIGIRLNDISDGLSGTVGAGEVKAYGPHLDLAANLPANKPTPATPAAAAGMGGQFSAATGHSAWAIALIWQTGLTFTFPPNTQVPYVGPADGQTYDVDSSGGGSTYVYAAITTRSYHSGGVSALFMDGSVRFVTNAIPRDTCRALGTRNGGEAVDGSGY